MPDPLAPDKIRLYAATVLEIGDPPALEVDLRRALGPEDAERVRSTVGAPEFTVITAANPGGAARPEAENQRANQALRRALEEEELHYNAVLGRDPDDTHREPGYGVAGPVGPAIRLARRFGQDGLFRFDGRRFLLIDTVTGAEHPLPLDSGPGLP